MFNRSKLSVICWLFLLGSAWLPLAYAPTYEDFTTYTEVLGGGADRYTQTTTRSSWAGLRRDDPVSYVYNDYTADYFSDFAHEMILCITDISSGNGATARLMLQPYTASTDLPAFSDDRVFWYITRKASDDTEYYITFMAKHDDVTDFTVWTANDGIFLDVGTVYYITVRKEASVMRLVIRTSSHEGAIVWDSDWQQGYDDSYQYLCVPFHSTFAVDGSNSITGYIEYLAFVTYARPTDPEIEWMYGLLIVFPMLMVMGLLLLKRR